MNLKSNLGILRILALIEGITLLLLPITMYLKYYNDMAAPNRLLGTLHGGLFIAYSIWILVVGREKKWNLGIMAIAFFASFVPFGTFIVDHYIFKKAQ
jgi:integral membrane protein